jgi:hypothetical protein
LTNEDELEGTTLKVYLYVIKEGKPVGPRDVTRGTNLSSPSVAYRHLQKLESLGLIEKDNYGQYIIKEKIGIKGHLWIGRSIVPRLMFYSFFFMGIFSIELVIVAVRLLAAETLPLEFIFLTFVTCAALIIFLVEGIKLLLRIKSS